MSTSSRPTGTTRGSARHELDDRRPPLRVARRRDDAGRLVQQDVRERLALDAVAVDLDDVVLPDRPCSSSPGSPLTRTRPCADQLVRPPSRRDAGAREVGVEAHVRHCALG